MKEFPLCPSCNDPLSPVRSDKGYLNADQFDSIKAGDWYCAGCPEEVGTAGQSNAGYAYFWDKDVMNESSFLTSKTLQECINEYRDGRLTLSEFEHTLKKRGVPNEIVDFIFELDKKAAKFDKIVRNKVGTL